MDGGGTSTGSARPPQPDLPASEGERLRHIAEQIISPDVLVVGGESEELARGVLRLLARVVLLEEALRAIAAHRPDIGDAFVGEDWRARIAREALVGDAPPPNTKPVLGAPPARAEQGRTSGDSA